MDSDNQLVLGENDNDDDPDPREPNPTSMLTPEFREQAHQSAAITYYRYYAPFATPKKASELDAYRQALHEYKGGLKCEICKSQDSDPRGFRIPVQCVAGTEEEYDWKNSGRVQIEGPLHSDSKDCSVAVHVGCARWGLPNPNNIQRVHWW
jgi:hypothetical protein